MSEQVDKQIAALARRQGGHVTRAQLLRLGVGRHEIAHRLQVGSLIRVHYGVCAVGHLPTTRRDQAAGALLACGPRAALSHSSAAALWNIEQRWPLPLELITTCDRRPKGLRVHFTTRLSRAEVTSHQGLRVTTPARTVLDIAPALSAQRLTRIINDLRLGRRLTFDELDELTRRHPGHRGARSVRALIAQDHGATRSELEDRFQQLVKQHKLPQPVMNTMIAGYEVDAYFPVERVIVELDGYQVHLTRKKFESDRARDSDILARTGIPTVRLTHRGMNDTPDREAAKLDAILSARRRR